MERWATIFIRNSTHFVQKTHLLSSQQGLDISNPKSTGSLLATQPLSVLLDHTMGFNRNVPSSPRSLPCISFSGSLQKGNQKMEISHKSRHVFDIQSPAFKGNVTEFKHALSQPRFIFRPRNIESQNCRMIGFGRDLE